MTDATQEAPGAQVKQLLDDASLARQDARGDVALTRLELAVSIARSSPYNVEYETWTRLLVELADLYVAMGAVDDARALMELDAPFIGKVNEIMQATGSPDQKRQAAGGWIKVRDRWTQLGLIGSPAPELGPTTWVLGEPASLHDHHGRVVLLEFWATWCSPCVEALGALRDLQRDLGADDLSVVALTRLYASAAQGPSEQAAELATIRNFVQGRELTCSIGVVHDDAIHRQFAATGLPTVVLIDRGGTVRSTHFGTRGFEFDLQLRQALEARA